ncbi:ADP-forming succinate--CoA ligase subunit beta [Turicimonas muris]|mgnify:FL=1|uniref:Succinate--CoA ligase [ADP-forming] subunit beta n=1 Tax=Turicimonas muris TaxID=1796652 RepID=A0A227KIG6_9BURK|nr:ADP-forming succinate--CoA ligase subunit beta [Turicimonas muris]ANU67128.1 succinate--CoA ligase subunit beta [Burkholderiales bacterium YL45]OXE47754.1 succinate--CoA ligase subunit beta [Turicimonas muris]QQQ95983.1 ADP-forming succinate--CoA ligase subunit beta [Turicimonas muris]
MKIHEYQAREILQDFDVPIPAGKVAETPSQAREVAEQLGGTVWAVKAQVHAGGRGKGGGVKLARNLEQVEELAKTMIGMRLVTKQTGSDGALVSKVLIQQGVNIVSEYYVGFLIDRANQSPVLLASSEGGMEIEKVAADFPEKIVKEYIDSSVGLTKEQAKDVVVKLNMDEKVREKAEKVLLGLWKAFKEKDCSLLEINPLIVTKEGEVFPLDAKMTFDDNALYRHPELEVLIDPSQEDETELKAHEAGLPYIQLDGNIACLVNGAGLAMATMDTIKLFGGEPANFLDIGGGASVEKVTAAFEIMLSKPEVKVILVNIFGGIMKCDTIAEGIVEACKVVSLTVPLVVRMKGTHEDLGKQILKESGLPIITAETLGEAALKAVSLAKEQ